MNKYKKVMLIYGGISSEREISIISSKGINDSLIRNNYEVFRNGILKSFLSVIGVFINPGDTKQTRTFDLLKSQKN